MKVIRSIIVENKSYKVTISDDTRALQAAYAAGGAIIGVLGNPDMSLKPAQYVVEQTEDVDEIMLEQVVRRRFQMPWIILETERLVIREFTEKDPLPEEHVDGDLFGVFCTGEGLKAYIENQYSFFGYGIWALRERETGCVIGKAGIDRGELGYHIYEKYRRRGYGKEACLAIIEYAGKTLGFEKLDLRARRDNTAAIALALSLGFRPADRRLAEEKSREQDGQVCFFQLDSI